jgi:hypothetical protein
MKAIQEPPELRPFVRPFAIAPLGFDQPFSQDGQLLQEVLFGFILVPHRSAGSKRPFPFKFNTVQQETVRILSSKETGKLNEQISHSYRIGATSIEMSVDTFGANLCNFPILHFCSIFLSFYTFFETDCRRRTPPGGKGELPVRHLPNAKSPGVQVDKTQLGIITYAPISKAQCRFSQDLKPHLGNPYIDGLAVHMKAVSCNTPPFPEEQGIVFR